MSDEPIADFFPKTVVDIFAALDNCTPEEEAIKLLEQEKEMRDNKIKEMEQE